jgi:hypothetical protein
VREALGMRRACCFDCSGVYSKGNMGAPAAAESQAATRAALRASGDMGASSGREPPVRDDADVQTL